MEDPTLPPPGLNLGYAFVYISVCLLVTFVSPTKAARGSKPPEAECLFYFACPKEATNLPHYWYWSSRRNWEAKALVYFRRVAWSTLCYTFDEIRVNRCVHDKTALKFVKKSSCKLVQAFCSTRPIEYTSVNRCHEQRKVHRCLSGVSSGRRVKWTRSSIATGVVLRLCLPVAAHRSVRSLQRKQGFDDNGFSVLENQYLPRAAGRAAGC